MKSNDKGVLEQSVCFTFTPSATARELMFYMTWCGHYYCDERYFMKRETYPYLLVMYICSGRMIAEYAAEPHVAEAGDVILMDCRNPHYYRAEEGLEFYYMHFLGSNSTDLCNLIIQEKGWCIRRKNNVLIRNLLAEAVSLNENSGVESSMTSSLRIYRILEVLMSSDENKTPMEKVVDHSVQYIKQHLNEQLTLQQLADEANLSVYYYSHIFKKRTGDAPMEYVIKTRIEKAKSLLIRTELSIDDVAAAVGYTAARSLINLFRKHVGMTPAQYRKEFHDR